MEQKIAQSLYRLNRFTFGVQLLALVSLCLVFYIFMMFGGGWDLSGSEFPGRRGTCTLLPFAFLLTFVTDLSYPRLKEQKLTTWLLLISTMILNAVLTIQVMVLVYTIVLFVLSLFGN